MSGVPIVPIAKTYQRLRDENEQLKRALSLACEDAAIGDCCPWGDALVKWDECEECESYIITRHIACWERYYLERAEKEVADDD